MTTEQLLRDALHADADAAPAPANWDGVRTRGTRIRLRRRINQGAVAMVTVVVIAVGALALAGTFSDGGRATRRGVVATPPGPVADRIVVDRGDRVEIVSATDGQVISTVATGIDAHLSGGVSVTPDGSAVVYTRQSSSSARCGPELVEQPLVTGGRAHVIVGFAHDPLVSPDGQWVAYVMNESCVSSQSSGDFLGVTNLQTGLNYRPYEQELSDHPAKLDLLAWSPDSIRLVYNEQRNFSDGSDQKTLMFSDPPLARGAAQSSLNSTGAVGAATFLPDGHLMLAGGTGRGYDILETDDQGNVLRTLAQVAGPVPDSIALDPSGTRLLVARPDGTLLVQEGSAAPREIATGVRGAAWLPTPVPTGPTSVTVPDVVGRVQNDATDALTRLGFNVTVNQAVGPSTAQPGTVLSQSVEPGSVVAPGTLVSIVVSISAAR